MGITFVLIQVIKYISINIYSLEIDDFSFGKKLNHTMHNFDVQNSIQKLFIEKTSGVIFIFQK